jgi:ABC-2 type transport system permease protein
MNNTYKWLLKREFWEHKGGFFWTPAVVGSIIALGTAASVVAGLAFKSKHGLNINGEQVTNLSRVVSAEDKARIVNAVSEGWLLPTGMLFGIMAIVVFFYCLGCLFDERKDRSVLFWKSLPVSDTETVLSKVAMALVAAPLLTLAFGIVTSVLVLLIGMAGAGASGLNLAGVFGQAATWTGPFELAAIIPVYLVWALPTVGWLMMVSAWARTKVFLWAVGVPVVTGVLLLWFNEMFDFGWNVEWFWHNIIARGLLSVVPGAWFGFVDPAGGLDPHRDIDFSFLVVQSWKTLASVHAWAGAAVGAAMIFAATRLRRWKDEG